MAEAILESWRGRIPYQAALLGVVSTVAASLLVGANLLTREPIAERQAEDLRASLSQVVPSALYDNNLLTDTVEIRDGDAPVTVYQARHGGEVAAVAYPLTAYGYSGAISLLMSVDRNGAILGVRVLAHAETPGLGDKIEVQKSDWIRHFEGLTLNNPPPEKWAVKKDGGVFDSFSGATITPRGVVAAIHHGLELFQDHRAEVLRVDSNEGSKP